MSLPNLKGAVYDLPVGPRAHQRSFRGFMVVTLILSAWVAATLTGCGGPSPEELEAVDYIPL